jgi:hypothetical protein
MLTPSQKALLKAAVNADNTLNIFPNDADGDFAIAQLLKVSSGVFFWDTHAKTSVILDAIDGTKYTPADTPDATTIFLNRCAVINIKQMNLQTVLVGRDTVDASKSNVRSTLRDAVMNLPAGALGANINAAGAGGVNVMNALMRIGTKAELIFSPGTAVTATFTANLFDREGDLSGQDVRDARDS